jgi:hypothetical protein
MPLKYKDVERKERQEKQAAEDARWKGPWGEICPVEQKHVRFVREVHGVEECWSYPYETLVRQVFKKSEPEEIEILAGGDTITIRGLWSGRVFGNSGKKTPRARRATDAPFCRLGTKRPLCA